MKKRFISFLLAAVMCVLSCAPVFALGNTTTLDASLPEGIVLREGEIWIPASEFDNIVSPLEDANSDCGKTGHIPPNGYRYVGCKKGNTDVDNLVVSAGGFLASLIVPDFGTLVGLIGVGLALDTSEIDGDYSIYTWTNGSMYWEHAVGYCTYTTASGKTVTEYVNCEIRHYAK